MKKKNISKNLKNLLKKYRKKCSDGKWNGISGRECKRRNPESEKRGKKRKERKKEARQRSCRAVVRLQSERSLLGVVKVTYCL